MKRWELDDSAHLVVGRLPEELVPDETAFDQLWNLHPSELHLIVIHGKQVRTPRWQQAYGADYRYTGRVNRALPIPAALEPIHTWIKAELDPRLNALLLNWYDATQAHYIGKHRDATADMITGSPIVTVSLGAERVFRMRRWKGDTVPHDVPTGNGTVIVLPYDVNLAWTHEVPHNARAKGRRISITARAFESAQV